jgi:transcriptional regulator with GAF, ATPase, and Fis domain
MLAQEMLVFRSVDELPPEATEEKQYIVDMGIKSSAIVPLSVGGQVIGSFAVDSMWKHRSWPGAFLKRLTLFGNVVAGAIVRQRADSRLRKAHGEISRLKEQLERENIYLRDQIELEFRHEEIVGRSRGLKEVLLQVEQVASTDSTVLLLGETGTGKELIAHQIHRLSRRNGRPMIKVNCAGLPSTLVESELFGREKGAYTGALSRQTGRFEIADGSTIFLDEIGDLPLELQVKLLRVLQDGEFERLGSSRTIKVDVRVIAATNRDLRQAVKNGTFREDLYYRLNVFPITIPPLRKRRDDILPLVWFFLKDFGRSMGTMVETIPRKTVEELQSYPWPGNVRELRNVLERAVIRGGGGSLQVDLADSGRDASSESLTLDEVQRRHILHVLEQTGWRVRGTKGAAAMLGMKPTTLEGRMVKLGIRRQGTSSRIS